MLQSSQTIILGMGATGLSCAKFLKQHNIPFTVIDTRAQPPALSDFEQTIPQLQYYLKTWPENLLLQAEQIILSPGFPRHHDLLKPCLVAGIPVIGDIELFAQNVNAPVIAITGSNGKSTVTALLGEMALAAGWNAKIGGNIGTPALELLMTTNMNGKNNKQEIYILELSSFQLESTFSLQPKAATLLNICDDHLDRYPNRQAYLQAKQKIFEHCEIAIVNRDQAQTYLTLNLANILSFGKQATAARQFHLLQQQGEFYLSYDYQSFFNVAELKIRGRHNWQNALAACALAHAVGIEQEAMIRALKTFTGLAHRCQWVANIGGVAWYNDSKGTNPGATLAAIEGLANDIDGQLILIAGGRGKNTDYTILKSVIDKYVNTIILFGEDADVMARALAGAADIIHVVDLPQAIHQAMELSRTNDVVLFSPAASSFDMFANYQQRGEVFCELVHRLL